MFAIFPTNDTEGAEGLSLAIDGKGHYVRILDDKKGCFYSALKDGSVFVAYGSLPPIASWMWGYANAVNRKVIVIRGVDPCFSAKTVPLEVWLERLPEQLRMF